ncbi:MAG: hypothetical protein ACFFB3_10890 [Candidatus Hodarchaeota archaeon]
MLSDLRLKEEQIEYKAIPIYWYRLIETKWQEEIEKTSQKSIYEKILWLVGIGAFRTYVSAVLAVLMTLFLFGTIGWFFGIENFEGSWIAQIFTILVLLIFLYYLLLPKLLYFGKEEALNSFINPLAVEFLWYSSHRLPPTSKQEKFEQVRLKLLEKENKGEQGHSNRNTIETGYEKVMHHITECLDQHEVSSDSEVIFIGHSLGSVIAFDYLVLTGHLTFPQAVKDEKPSKMKLSSSPFRFQLLALFSMGSPLSWFLAAIEKEADPSAFRFFSSYTKFVTTSVNGQLTKVLVKNSVLDRFLVSGFQGSEKDEDTGILGDAPWYNLVDNYDPIAQSLAIRREFVQDIEVQTKGLIFDRHRAYWEPSGLSSRKINAPKARQKHLAAANDPVSVVARSIDGQLTIRYKDQKRDQTEEEFRRFHVTDIDGERYPKVSEESVSWRCQNGHKIEPDIRFRDRYLEWRLRNLEICTQPECQSQEKSLAEYRSFYHEYPKALYRMPIYLIIAYISACVAFWILARVGMFWILEIESELAIALFDLIFLYLFLFLLLLILAIALAWYISLRKDVYSFDYGLEYDSRLRIFKGTEIKISIEDVTLFSHSFKKLVLDSLLSDILFCVLVNRRGTPINPQQLGRKSQLLIVRKSKLTATAIKFNWYPFFSMKDQYAKALDHFRKLGLLVW